MIQRAQCLPRKITRRGFGMLTGSAIGAEFLARMKEAKAAARSPFTIALVPDPQFLSGDATCSGATEYNALIQWGITNRNLSVAGSALNIKGFVTVGDICDAVSPTSFETQQQRAVNAFALAEAASPKMFVSRCCGNHDIFDGATNLNRDTLGYMWRADKAGAWSPSNVAAIYGSGMDLGNGDVAFFGGVYADPTFPVSTANNYMRLWVQGMRILIINLEYYPRIAVLNWAKSIHDMYPDHQCWMFTHGYMTTTGILATRGSTYGPNINAAFATNDGSSNSGVQMWGGSTQESGVAGWAGFTSLSNLTGVFCGHWVDGYLGGSDWVYKRLQSTSTSSRGQTVQQIFCNCQSADQTNFCASNPSTPDGTSDTMHLLLMRFTPATGMMENFLVSTNNGKWTGISSSDTSNGASGGRNATSAITLCNVSMPSPAYLFPPPSALR